MNITQVKRTQFQTIIQAIAVFGLVFVLSIPSNISASSYENGKEKVTICHATASDSNPYVEINISSSGENVHLNHQWDEDEISDDFHCTKNTPPTITLTGTNPITLSVGDTFTDPGATAVDAEDGSLTSHIVVTGGPVNTTLPGTTTLIYSVTDSGGLTASTTRTVVVSALPVSTSCDVVSDITNMTGWAIPAVATYSGNSAWTASIPGATWIWDSYFVTNPTTDQSVTFTKTFTVSSSSLSTLTVAADNSYTVTLNGVLIGGSTSEYNYRNENVGTYLLPIHAGVNTLQFTVKNWALADSSAQTNPAGLLYKLHINNEYSDCTKNTPPTITLTGTNPITLSVGDTFTDPGATAVDAEDGSLTSHIVVTGGPVNTTLPGTTTLIYSVTDSGGLTASTTRTVVVNPVSAHVPTIHVVATKITCDAEIDLPNWGEGGANITASTTENFLKTHPNCHLTPDWKFQWGFDGVVSNPGETFIGEASTGWHTSNTTGVFGTTTFDISPVGSTTIIWVREVLKDGYLPFTYPNGNDNPYSAEMYCHTDVLHYDNFDFISGVKDGGTYYCVAFNVKIKDIPTNTPPTITLNGANPFNINVGETFTDPGAVGTDLEDGDATTTAHIIVTGTVGTTAGTYTLTYSVTDSGGLTASTTRTVVVNPIGGGENSTGTLTFCVAFADLSNTLATSSLNLPAGTLTLTIGTTTDIAQSLVESKTWSMSTFAPNQHIILSSNDAECVTYINLPFGNYYYSQASTTGTALIGTKYNDQYDTPVNSIFDFFNYSPELFTATTTDDASRNFNSDGQITLNSLNTNRTLVMFASYNPASTTTATNTPPTITLNGANPFNINVGETFTDPGAVGTDLEDGDATTTAHIIVTGTVGTTAGTYTLTYSVTDSGGLTASTTRTVVVNAVTTGSGCTTNCGGGGGGGNGPIVGSLTSAPAVGNGPIALPVVLGESTSTVPNGCYYLRDYLHIGWNNDPTEVKKLQIFLRDLEGHTNITVNGIYDDETVKAVNEFQVKYGSDILIPWDGTYTPSSFTYILTKKKVNEIYCKTAFPVSAQEQSIIDAYNKFIHSLNENGIPVISGTDDEAYSGPVVEAVSSEGTASNSNNVPKTNSSVTSNLLAIGGPLGSTTKLALANFATAILGFPLNWMKGLVSPNSCTLGQSIYCKLIDILLMILIVGVVYLLIRTSRKQKTIEELNKDLDLK